jgi:hypothetical protein
MGQVKELTRLQYHREARTASAKIDPRNFEAQMTNAQAKVEGARSSVSNAGLNGIRL